jgi:hypothetical protein
MDDHRAKPEPDEHQQSPPDQDATDLDAVRSAVAHGIADADAGRVLDAAKAFDELEARYRKLSSRA